MMSTADVRAPMPEFVINYSEAIVRQARPAFHSWNDAHFDCESGSLFWRFATRILQIAKLFDLIKMSIFFGCEQAHVVCGRLEECTVEDFQKISFGGIDQFQKKAINQPDACSSAGKC